MGVEHSTVILIFMRQDTQGFRMFASYSDIHRSANMRRIIDFGVGDWDARCFLPNTQKKRGSWPFYLIKTPTECQRSASGL